LFLISDYYVHFIIGEGKLETYCADNPLSEQTTAGGPHPDLDDAERHLKTCIKENGKVDNIKNDLDFFLMLIHYIKMIM